MSDKNCPKCGKERCEVMDAYHENDEAGREHVCHGHAQEKAREAPEWEKEFHATFSFVFPNLWHKEARKGPMRPEDIKSFIRSLLSERDALHREEVRDAYLEGFNEARLVAEDEVTNAYRPFRHITRDYQDVDRLRDDAKKRIREIQPSAFDAHPAAVEAGKDKE